MTPGSHFDHTPQWKRLSNKKAWAALAIGMCIIASFADNPAETKVRSASKFVQSVDDSTIQIEAGTIKQIANSMTKVKGGAFVMGCEKGGDFCLKDAAHPHRVELDDYLISKFEVTQSQWEAVMGKNPSSFSQCKDCPVEMVSWHDVHVFLDRLNRVTQKEYRLPTEAEWEYAARGGDLPVSADTTDAAWKTNAWYSANSGGKTHPVGQKQPNSFGLYDMAGNVYEWCHDPYSDLSYPRHADKNPQGYNKRKKEVVASLRVPRVLRGGSWAYDAHFCIPTYRDSSDPDKRYPIAGFRLAHSL